MDGAFLVRKHDAVDAVRHIPNDVPPGCGPRLDRAVVEVAALTTGQLDIAQRRAAGHRALPPRLQIVVLLDRGFRDYRSTLSASKLTTVMSPTCRATRTSMVMKSTQRFNEWRRTADNFRHLIPEGPLIVKGQGSRLKWSYLVEIR